MSDSIGTRPSSQHVAEGHATHRRCTCLPEAGQAWNHIRSVTELGLDGIKSASEQTQRFVQKFVDCDSPHPHSVIETILLDVYGRLLDFFEAALLAYASFTADLGTPALSPSASSSSSLPGSAQRSPGMLPSQAYSSESAIDTRPGQRQSLICTPTSITLGDFELDHKQSQHVALAILAQALRANISTLQQARFRKAEGGAHGSMSAYARSIRLLGMVSTAQHALK